MYRQALANIIDTWENCKVIIQATNGADLLGRINPNHLPTFALIDLNMPVMNGYDTIKALKEKHPAVHVIVVSMHKSAEALLLLMQYNIQGYLSKNDDISQIKKAFAEITCNGTYFPDQTIARMARHNGHTTNNGSATPLTTYELSFLSLVCSNKTYKEIAGDLNLSERRVESLRETLFVRFNVKCRSGLAKIAMEHGLACWP